MKLRIIGAFTALTLLLSSGVGVLINTVDTPAASAARPVVAPVTTQVPCTVAGVASTCTLQLTGVQAVNGALQSSGTVTGGGVSVPFSGVPVLDPAGGCSILNLTLGPLHLDLLGLVVDLSQVTLNVTAVPGPGNLLGNLLCAVAHLLDSTGASQAVANLLNSINQLLAGL